MAYRLNRPPDVVRSLERLSRTDPDGARLLTAAILGLSDDPRPDGVRRLGASDSLYRLHLSRIDRVSKRTLHYRLLYQVFDEQVLVVVVTASALPAPSRRR